MLTEWIQDLLSPQEKEIKSMRTPESWLKRIEKLRAEHTRNDFNGKWELNDTVRRKIITAWEGYHGAISKQLDKGGLAVGNESVDYSQPTRIQHLIAQRDYFMRKTDNKSTPLERAQTLLNS